MQYCVFYRDCNHNHIPDPNVDMEGFQMVRADRKSKESGKRRGGGLAVYVNRPVTITNFAGR